MQSPMIIHKELIADMDLDDNIVLKHTMISPIVEDLEIIE